MARKILITLDESDVAPRFDLTTEVLVITLEPDGELQGEKTIVLPHSSPEELCHLILAEGVDEVVTGGIEEEYYQYLTWKKVRVFDSVMGPFARAVELLREGSLSAGDILFARLEEA